MPASTQEKMILGGIGGLTPLCAGLLVLDVSVLDSYVRQVFDPDARGDLHIAGYIIKAILLFVVGAFWAYLHRSERNILRIFQIGIVAPALFVGFIDAAEIRTLRKESRVDRITLPETNSQDEESDDSSQEKSQDSLRFNVMRSANAAEPSCRLGTCRTRDGRCTAEACEPSWYEKIWAGFLTRPTPTVLRCNERDVTAIIPYGLTVTVIENTEDQSCDISIEGASSERKIRCSSANATLVVPEHYSVSVREENGKCKFAVQATTDSH